MPFKSITTINSKTGMILQAGDEIHVIWPDYHSKTAPGVDTRFVKQTLDYEIARPVTLLDDSRIVTIGDIVYDFGVTAANTIDIHHDISFIRFHNHLSMPIDIWYQGLKIGSVSGDDGTGYMAGSPNSVYLSNDRFGFKIGQKITFSFPNGDVPYATATLVDNYTSDIIVGMTTQHVDLPPNDVFAYRVNTPNVTGLRYYDVEDNAYGDNMEGVVYVKGKVKQYYNVNAVSQGVKL